MFNKLKEGGSFLGGKLMSEKTALFLTFLILIFIILVTCLIVNALIPKPRVEITISGPEKANAGEWVVYKVTCKNTGNVILEKPELAFQFPTESFPEKTKFESVLLGDFLIPKEKKEVEFKAQLLGQEGEERTVKTWLTYKKKGGEKLLRTPITVFNTSLKEIPLDLILDFPQKIELMPKSDSEFSFRVRYFSFIEPSIENLKIKVEFPKNFLLKEASIPSTKTGEWFLNKLQKGDGGEINFNGVFPKNKVVFGEELKTKIQLFAQLPEKDVLLKEISGSGIASEAILLFSLKINGKEDYKPYPGELLHYQLSFKNITTDPLRNLKLTIKLEGPLFDLETIEAPQGDFVVGDNSISWTEEKVSLLGYLTPGNRGEIEFWVKLKNNYKPKDISETNAQIKTRVFVAGYEKEYMNKVNTKIVFQQEGYYNDKYGFFQNTGPHPPRVNETTTYTIVWKYENYYNQLDNAKITASFDPGIKIVSTKGDLKIEQQLLLAGGYIYPGIPPNFRFQNPLQEGMTSEEVRYLQTILSKEVPHAWPKNQSPTGYFGKITVEAVKAFQIKYKSEILDPQKLQKPTGYVDEFTRLKLNELLSKALPLGGGKIIWDIGKIEAGKGVFDSPPMAAFQIAITPELSQKGKILTLIHEALFTANDVWTGNPLRVQDDAITTLLTDDPGATLGEGKVR